MNDNLKIKIVDGNDEVELSTAPKENIKAYMVKGEAGTSSQVDVVRTGSKVVLTTTDSRGTNSVEINDGVSPTVDTSRTDNVTTVTIEDIEGIKTAEIYDGIDLTGGVPTNGVIGFDVTEIIYTCDGTETGDYYLTYENVDYYFTMPPVDDGDILVFNVDDLELSLDGSVITTSSTGTGTELTFIDNIPNGYEETDESLGGADIPQQATAPINPKENDLWIDTDETGLTTVDSTVSTTSTNPVENQAITNYVDNECADTISKLLPSNLIKLDTATTTTSLTLGAFASQYVGVTVPAIDGYTPWLCYEVLGSGQSGVRGYTNPVNLSTMQVGCWVTNFTNTSQTVPGVVFKIMYIKNIN